ncbi:hypothetical protein MASR2M48_16740 [Spirochaetota bacterium]
MKNADDYRRLAGELTVDIELLHALQTKHAKAAERALLAKEDDLIWAAVGYTIHNIYCLLENYFLRISKFLKTGLILAHSTHYSWIHYRSLQKDFLPDTTP